MSELDLDALSQRPPKDATGAFDLDSFAPAPIRFRKNGRGWELPGDPDVDLVAQMLRIEEAVRAGDAQTVAAAVVEGRKLLSGIARTTDDVDREKAVCPVPLSTLDEIFAALGRDETDEAARLVSEAIAGAEAYQHAHASELRVGVGELLTLFSLVTGGTTVASAVGDAIRAEAEAGEGPLAGSPSRSGEPSSAPSSTSESREGGRRTTSGGSRGASGRRTSQRRSPKADGKG